MQAHVPQFSACVLQSIAVAHWPASPEVLPLLLPPLPLPLLLPPLPPPNAEPPVDASCPNEGPAELLLDAPAASSDPGTRIAFTPLILPPHLIDPTVPPPGPS